MESSQSQQQIVVPDVSYHSHRTTSVINSYARRQSTLIGVLLIIAGALSMIFGSIDVANVFLNDPYYPKYGTANGIYCGLMSIVAGGFAIGTAHRKTRCMIITFMVLAIISAIFAATQSVAGGVSSWMFSDLIAQSQSLEHPKLLYVTYKCGKSYICEDVNAMYAINVVISMLGVVEFGLCLWGSIICCATGGYCCCGPADTDLIAMPLVQPQASEATATDQQQQQTETYSSQVVVHPASKEYPGYAPK